MPVIGVTDSLAVAGQPGLEDFPALAAAGIKVMINNRPDGEEAGQPGTAAEAKAAVAAGMSYVHIPVTMANITEADVRAFQAAVTAADGPVLAHCRSGTRSLILWAIGEVLDGRMTADELPPFGAERGIDLRAAQAWLAQHGHD